MCFQIPPGASRSMVPFWKGPDRSRNLVHVSSRPGAWQQSRAGPCGHSPASRIRSPAGSLGGTHGAFQRDRPRCLHLGPRSCCPRPFSSDEQHSDASFHPSPIHADHHGSVESGSLLSSRPIARPPACIRGLVLSLFARDRAMPGPPNTRGALYHLLGPWKPETDLEIVQDRASSNRFVRDGDRRRH